jgi:protein-S-isoprenylcysteine O-methyltransferase Ste14
MNTTTAATKPTVSPALLDRGEQVLILSLWVWLVQRVLHSLANGVNPDSWLLLVSETAVMIFTLIRRPTEAISLELGDWLLAITATAAPLLIEPAPEAIAALRPVGVMMVLFGNLVQASAKLTLARSFGIAPANRGVKVSGPYRLIRHPMYGGYLWVHVGLLLLMPSLLNVVIYAIGWTAQIRRLLAEEALLGQDEAYRAYQDKVRWRLVPGLF